MKLRVQMKSIFLKKQYHIVFFRLVKKTMERKNFVFAFEKSTSVFFLDSFLFNLSTLRIIEKLISDNIT